LPLTHESTGPLTLEVDSSRHHVDSVSSSTFTYGLTEESKQVGDSVQVYIPLEAGYSMTSGSVNVSLEGSEVSSTQTYSVSNGGLNGTMNGTDSDGSAIALQTATSGPPQAGNNSSFLLNGISLSGVHAYDTLELACGFTSCGSIAATGDLTLYVNTLIVGQGTFIEADDLVGAGTGAGTSTTTQQNGRNDGGGGAGHGSTGGSGGGTNGGSGGSSYGNGTERGSQGGGVSSSYHPAVYGGQGGGYIKIYADTIIVNGSIEADGGNGDAGSQASSGTGAGGSGGGGGSGGSIFIQTNSLTLGSNGVISSNGGNGGDGADGAQNGIGFGMYDGGDGGGGGGGGRISVSTQAGGYSNSGTVASTAGSGGVKGLKYGTGIDGYDGTSGTNGIVTTSTWGGYLATGNVTRNNGTFVSQPIETQPSHASTAYLAHTVSVPVNSSLIAHYRWTMGGDDTSWDHWSDWSELPLTGTWIPRHHWIQVKYAFNRTSSASPTLSAIALQTSEWTTLEDAAFDYDGISTSIDYQNTPIGFTDALVNTSSTQSHGFTFDLPLNATLLDDARVWMGWTSVGPPDHPPANFNEAVIGSTVVNSSLLNWQEEGHDLKFDAQVLQTLIDSATPWTNNDGMQWVTLNVSISMLGDTTMTFGDLWMPWSISSTVQLDSQVNSMILSECTSFYGSTDGLCLGTDGSHPFTFTGSTLPVGAPAFSYTIDAPAFDWEDSFAPEIDFIQHRKGIEPTPDVRVGEGYSLVLFDLMNEPDLTVQMLGHDWQESDGFANATSMAYYSALQGYYLMMSTEGLNADSTQQLNLTFRVLDSNLNERTPRPTYTLTVYPSEPEVGSLSISGTSHVTGEFDAATWDVDGAMFEFGATDINQRSSLDVNLHLTHQLLGTVDLEMNWSQQNMEYVALWQPSRDHLGQWSIEVDMREVDGLLGMDSDGLSAGQDAMLLLVDNQGPVLSTVDYAIELERGTPQFVNLSWGGQEGETSSGSISIVQDGSVLDFKNILPTLVNSSSLMFETDDLEPGQYSIVIQLEDDAGNQAVHDGNASYSFEVLPPWVDGDVAVNYHNETAIQIVGNIVWRTGSGQLTLVDSSGSLSEQLTTFDGPFEVLIPLEGSLQPAMSFTLAACDLNQSEICFNQAFDVNFTTSFVVDVDSICTVTNLELKSSDSAEAVSCEVFNDGFVPATVKFVTPMNASLASESTVLMPGESKNMVLTLQNGTDDLNRSVEWSLTAENTVNGPKLIDTGQVQTNRTLPSNAVEPTAEDPSDDASSSNSFLPSVIGLLVLFAAVGGLFYRFSKKGETDDFVDSVTEELLPESFETTPVDEEFTEPEVQPQSDQAMQSSPSPEQVATSVDGSGYEWFTSGEHHWYRSEGSTDEWFPFEG